MPITAIAGLSFWDMAFSVSWAPLASFSYWQGRSTAGPFHYRTFRVRHRKGPEVERRATAIGGLSFFPLERAFPSVGASSW
jgi:hypothetical protein